MNTKNKRAKKGKGRLKKEIIYKEGRTIHRLTAAHDPEVKTSSSKKKGLKHRVTRNLKKLKKFVKQFLSKKRISEKIQVSPYNISSNTRRKKEEIAIQKRLADDYADLLYMTPSFFYESSSNSFTRKHRKNNQKNQKKQNINYAINFP
tara:strand:+ start:1337 stop:1780 length:444 start_codon:yes stop_codon:yes gene_type:complete